MTSPETPATEPTAEPTAEPPQATAAETSPEEASEEAEEAPEAPPVETPLPARGRDSYRRSREAELAARRIKAAGPQDPAWPSSVLLLREAIHWASLARAEARDVPPLSPPETWAEIEPTLATRLSPEDVAALKAVFFEPADLGVRALPPEAIDRQFDALQLILQATLEGDPFFAHDLRKFRKLVLKVGAVALLAALVVGGATLALRRGKNIALNVPTRTSSTWKNYTTSNGAVDGLRTGIGFHTDQQQNPWIELDLGAMKTIHSVHVYNSLHCCEQRADPLVVEVSSDRRAFKQVARHDGVFDKWVAKFAPTQTRYVRLSVPKETYLHLSEVEVY